MFCLDLRADWSDLLARRPTLATTLVPYGPIIDAWASWAPPAATPPSWDRARCEERWRRGVPALAESPLAIGAVDVEDTLAVAMEAVTAARPTDGPSMRRLADGWDAGQLDVTAFLPARGAVGAAAARQLGISEPIVAFLAYAGLRPAIEWNVLGARTFVVDGAWTLGVCPWCGAPPGFADIAEDGRRQLACHLCGGAWVFSRVRCPLCGADGPGELSRLEPGGADEAYFISGCTRCHGYVKELDRRQRWNARGPLVEDWGSPHLDLVARRAGKWRPLPTLVDLATPL